MILRISSWAIRQPLAPLIIFAGLLLAGAVAYFRLPVNNMPNVQIPIVNVSVVLPGAASSEIESQITRPVEAALAGVGHIKHITSSVTDSISSTQIEFQLGTDLNNALSKVRDQMAEVRPSLPHGAEDPLIQRVEADSTPILTFTVTAPQRSLEGATWFVDDQVTRSLLAIKGVAKVQRQGGVDREIHIDLDPARLKAYGVSAKAINDQLRQTVLTLPAGRMGGRGSEILIRTVNAPVDLNAFSNMEIALPGGRFVRLRDLGMVRDTVREPRQLARLGRQPVVAFAVYRARSASEINVESGVTDALKLLKQANPDIEFTRIQSLVEFTRENFHSGLWAFLEGALLAAVVVFVFLRNWRATWVAGLVIPLSVIPTFLVMQWFGFSLNMVSLLALSLVSGILVDDAIVEIENIMRHLRMGKSAYQAAIDAADEIGLAVVATTLVVVAVFLPVSFMGGVVGQYFIQFGLTVAVATLFSLLVARLITPVLAAYFLNPIKHFQYAPQWIDHYQKWLEMALKHRKFMVLSGIAIMMGSFAIWTLLPTEFMPIQDKSQSTLQVELAPGSRLADTDSAVGALSKILLRQPEVKSVYALIGGPDSETNIEGEIRHATLTIQLVPRNHRTLDIRSFEHEMLKKLSEVPNVRIGFLNENGSKAVTLTLTSDNPALLQRTAMEVAREMRGLKELSNVSSTIPLPRTELKIIPRPDDAARLGVTTEAISDTTRVATMGDLNMNLAKLDVGGRQIPVRVLLGPGDRLNQSEISQLQVPSDDGKMIPLTAVADIRIGAGPANITRFDRQRQISLEADLNESTLGEAMVKINALPTIKKLPSGVARYDTGDAELLSEMFYSFLMAMIAGVLMVFVVLVLLFRTLLQPLTIMVGLPLSIVGALLALLFSQFALSLPAVIGVLMLMGIVGKNGILLVDFIIERRSSGMSRQAAILEACQLRARPIVMTSLAMIAGMLPVILGLGADTAFRSPMAIAVIGGLITSTALSLVFIPVIYTYIDDFEGWMYPKLRRLTTLSVAG